MGRSDRPDFNQGWITPQLPQRQDSLTAQLSDVAAMANRMGCCDAADAIRNIWLESSDQVEGARDV